MKGILTTVSVSTDQDDLGKILKAAYQPAKSKLATGKALATQAYTNYASGLTNLGITPLKVSTPAIFDKTVSKAYYNLYDSKAEHVERVKTEVEDRRDTDECLLCALNDYDSLDHYLPRAIFPEYAISARNLVPACTVCNRKWKKQKWGAGANRPFLHPYIDVLPDVDFLVCNVNVVDNSFVINFSINKNNIPGALGNVLANHFINLDLENRYIKRTIKEDVDELIGSMQKLNTFNAKKVALEDYIDTTTNFLKRNSRRKSFYLAVRAISDIVATANWPAI